MLQCFFQHHPNQDETHEEVPVKDEKHEPAAPQVPLANLKEEEKLEHHDDDKNKPAESH